MMPGRLEDIIAFALGRKQSLRSWNSALAHFDGGRCRGEGRPGSPAAVWGRGSSHVRAFGRGDTSTTRGGTGGIVYCVCESGRMAKSAQIEKCGWVGPASVFTVSLGAAAPLRNKCLPCSGRRGSTKHWPLGNFSAQEQERKQP